MVEHSIEMQHRLSLAKLIAQSPNRSARPCSWPYSEPPKKARLRLTQSERLCQTPTREHPEVAQTHRTAARCSVRASEDLFLACVLDFSLTRPHTPLSVLLRTHSRRKAAPSRAAHRVSLFPSHFLSRRKRLHGRPHSNLSRTITCRPLRVRLKHALIRLREAKDEKSVGFVAERNQKVHEQVSTKRKSSSSGRTRTTARIRRTGPPRARAAPRIR